MSTIRLAFLPVSNWSLDCGDSAFEEVPINFEWVPGQNWQQKQKSVKNMHKALSSKYPDLKEKILEVSTKSERFKLGQALSSFNLSLVGNDGDRYPVENVFQSSKIFNDGGPYLDLLNVEPKNARRDCRVQTADSKRPCETNDRKWPADRNFECEFGYLCFYCQNRRQRTVKKFTFAGEDWGPIPHSMFYDTLYIRALLNRPDLVAAINNYDCFTDIEFNQKDAYATKGLFNCQARSCAIYRTLRKSNLRDFEILELISSQARMKELYGVIAGNATVHDMSVQKNLINHQTLFDMNDNGPQS